MATDPARVQARRAAVGGRIRAVRTGLAMSQQALAERAGVDRAFLSNVENGRVDCAVGWLCDVADALGVNAWELLADIPKVADGPRPPRKRPPSPRRP